MSTYRFSPRLSRRLVLVLLIAALLPFVGAFSRATAADVVTLTYGWWSNGPEGDASHKAWLAEFEAAHPDIKIEAEILPWGAYWEKLQTTTAGGNAYDVLGFTSSLMAPYMANGVLLDLSKLEGYAEFAGRVNADVLKIFEWDGQALAMPIGVAARSLGYRTDFFKEAGLEPLDPTKALTIDQIIEIGKKLTVTKDGKIVRYAWNPNVGEPWNMFVSNRGGSFFDRYVNPTKVTINTPEGIAGLKDFQRLFTENIVPPWAEWEDNQWGTGGLDSLQTNTIAMADMGPWTFATIAKENLPVANTLYPVATEGQTSLLYSGANAYAINASSQHIEEAWTFLKWITGKQAALNYAKWSDIPANNEAFAEVFKTLEPQALVPATQEQLKGFRPNLLTANTELDKFIKQTLRDLSEGRLTAEEAAALMETEGNALLAGN
jgi:multiple sugar transport system substrate-binding protein